MHAQAQEFLELLVGGSRGRKRDDGLRAMGDRRVASLPDGLARESKPADGR
jgi:hypothetical protein